MTAAPNIASCRTDGCAGYFSQGHPHADDQRPQGPHHPHLDLNALTHIRGEIQSSLHHVETQKFFLGQRCGPIVQYTALCPDEIARIVHANDNEQGRQVEVRY